jgi:succinate-semialdehyde dehydrogenase / glutarate-semialdehyde dehydrogenase
MQSINPATDEVLAEHASMREPDVEERVERAYRTFCDWRRIDVRSRATLLARAADLLEARREELARLMAMEMGKPVRQGRKEVEKCALVCRYFAELGPHFLARMPVQTDAQKSYVSFEPLGVVLAIMPWNFPLWQVFRFAAPTLIAGNTVLLKHASNVPGCSLAIERLLHDAGLPNGALCALLIDAKSAEDLVDHERVAAVSLTGSPAAGASVAKRAGAALKKSVLELGGSDPYIILEDANVPFAAEVCARSRLLNSGQSCIAAKRFIAVDRVYDEFEEHFCRHMASARVGDPLAEDTTVGPLARRDLRDALHEQVRRSLALGAHLRLGGEVPDAPGSFYPPTVLSEVEPGTPAYEEELFGPVAALMRAPDEREALRMANDSVYGLGAALFTEDLARGELLARRDLEAGSVFVNSQVRSDPRLPFGGVKSSGYGRELSVFGIRELVNVKTVYVR